MNKVIMVAPLWSHVTVIDIHIVREDSHSFGVTVDPNRSILWGRKSWPFPVAAEVHFRNKFVSYVAKQRHGDRLIARKVRDWCDFYIPEQRWPEDIGRSIAAEAISRKCSQALATAGYANFGEKCK